MSTHTPGPWECFIEDTEPEWVMVMAGGISGRLIANVNAESCPDSSSAPAFVKMPQKANAALIASAPDMRDALHSIAVQSWTNPTEAIECIEYARATARSVLGLKNCRVSVSTRGKG